MPNTPAFYQSNVIVANPATAAEAVVCLVPGVTTSLSGDTIKLRGWANIGPDATCTQVIARIRRGSLTGAQVGNDGIFTPGVAFGAGTSGEVSIEAEDNPGDVAAQIYVLTLEGTAATGSTSVHNLSLVARVD